MGKLKSLAVGKGTVGAFGTCEGMGGSLGLWNKCIGWILLLK